MLVVSFLVGIYYNMVIAWSFFYTFASFAEDVPWKTCDNPWNTAGNVTCLYPSFMLQMGKQYVCNKCYISTAFV